MDNFSPPSFPTVCEGPDGGDGAPEGERPSDGVLEGWCCHEHTRQFTGVVALKERVEHEWCESSQGEMWISVEHLHG